MNASFKLRALRQAVSTEVERCWRIFKPSRRAVANRPVIEMLDPRVLLSSAVTGIAFNDADGNGSQGGGEGPLMSVNATVYVDLNNNGVLNTGEPSVATSSADGSYSVGSLSAGTYTIGVIPPSGYETTTGSPSVSVDGSTDTTGVNIGIHQIPPSAPTGLVATTVSTTEIDLTWSIDAATTDATVCEFDGATYTSLGVPGGRATSYDVTGLVAGTDHSFEVVASNGGGDSSPSTSADATTLPDPATDLTAPGVTDTTASLAWKDSASAASAKIYVSADGISYSLYDTISPNTTSNAETVMGLDNAEEYYFEIVDSDAGGDATSISTTAFTLPALPGLGGTAPNPNEIDLTFTNNANHITGYTLASTTLGITNMGFGPGVGGTDFTGLQPDTTYYFTLEADWMGSSGPTDFSITTPPLEPIAGLCSCNGAQDTANGAVAIPADNMSAAQNSATTPLFGTSTPGVTLSDDTGAGASDTGGLGGAGTVLGGVSSITSDTAGDITVVNSPTDQSYFMAANGGAESFGGTDQLTDDSGDGLYLVTTATGTVSSYYDFSWGAKSGHIKSVEDAAGNTIDYSYNTDGTPASIACTLADSTVTSYVYSYVPSGANVGKLDSIEYGTGSGGGFSESQETDYSYYGSGALTGYLETSVTKDGSGNTLDSNYYRYYSGEAGGPFGAVKYVMGMDSYARLAAALSSGTTPLTATDAQLAPYADMYYTYDSEGRVASRTLQGEGCSACAGGLGTFTFAYADNSGGGGSFNSWTTKTVETLPDGTVQSYYYNSSQEQMLEVTADAVGGRSYGTFTEYDSEGRAILSADSNAVILPANLATLEQYNDLLNNVSGNYQYLADSTGEITTTDYYSSTTATTTSAGGVADDVEDTKIQNGETGSAVTQEAEDYIALNSSGSIVYQVADDTLYGTNGGDARTTSYAYAVYSGTTQIELMTTSLPTVGSGQNGPGSADVTSTFYDENGQPIWTKDANGNVSYTAYDAATGAVTETIQNVVYADLTSPQKTSFGLTGWTDPAGGLNLVTQYSVDALGRTTKETDPNGTITYTVYDDADLETRVYPGFASGATTGPIQITRTVLPAANSGDLLYTESMTSSATPATTSGLPNGTETLSAGNIQSLTRQFTNAAGQVLWSDSYSSMSGVTFSEGVALSSGAPADLGSSGTNFNRTIFAYDDDGRQNKVVEPSGTIDRTVYDGMGRVISQYVGTDDTPSSGYWSPGNLTGTNTLDVQDNDYDTQRAPALPTLSSVAGGSLSGATYYVNITYLINGVETAPTMQTQLGVTGSHFLSIASPGKVFGATGYNVYVSTTSGAEKLQNTSPIAIGTDWTQAGTISTSGATVPTGRDGTVNVTVQHPGGGQADRISVTAYDYRGNPALSEAGLVTGTNSTPRSITYVTYDNLNEPTEQDTYDGTSDQLAAVTFSSGVPDAPSSTLLAQSTTAYDDQGRVYQTQVFSVSSGTASGDALTTNTFYDHNGNVIAVYSTGQPTTKSVYDGANRVIAQFTTDGGAVGNSGSPLMGWSDAGSIINDIVMSQTETTYDADGNVVLTTTVDRSPTAVGTGDLDPSGDPAAAGFAHVVGRQIFYNDSAFDGNNTAINSSDDSAIATDKSALLPGQTGTFSNYTSYTNGINGIMIDVAGLPSGGSLSASDFVFLVGNSSVDEVGAPVDLSTWSAAPSPSAVTVRTGAGTGGSDRVEITWADGSIMGEWLQVQIKPDANTGLAGTDVFYYGNAPADSGNSSTDAYVNTADELSARGDPHTFLNPASITDVNDFNRDARVGASDEILARTYATDTTDSLKLIAAPDQTRATYVADYYDAADRITAEANVGTNGGSVYTRPGSAPSRSDSVLVTTFGYDAAGNQNTVTDPRDIVTKTDFDMLGEVTDTIAAYTGGSPSADSDQTTDYTHDGNGDVLTMTAVLPASVATISTATESSSTVTITTSAAHDFVVGQSVTIAGVGVTNYNGTFTITAVTSTTFTYTDTHTGLSSSSGGTATVSLNQTTEYVYGIGTTPGTDLFSNDLIAKTEYPDPITGAASSSANNDVTYAYDNLGETTTMVDQNGTSHAYAYDSLGRLTLDAVTLAGGNPENVDNSILALGYTYTALSLPYKQTSYSNTAGTTVVNQVEDVYNGLEQLTGQYQEHSGAVNTGSSLEVQYGYSSITTGSRLATMTYPNGRILHFGYGASGGLDDVINRVDFLADDNGSGDIGSHLVDYTYLGISTILTQSQANGIDLTETLDQFGNIAEMNWVNTSTGTSTDDFQYAYDRDGNVLYKNNLVNSSFSELYHTNSATSGDDNAAYDALNRLTNFTRGALSSSGNNGATLDTVTTANTLAGSTQDFSLDAIGNQTSVTTDGTTVNNTANGQNELTTVGTNTLTSDHNGNMTTDESGNTYTYDAWNRLISVTSSTPTLLATYSYDASGWRITETHSGTTTDVYFTTQDQAIEERQSGTVTNQYVWSIDFVNDLLLRDDNSTSGSLGISGSGLGRRLFSQHDANFNVSAITNTSGTVQQRDVYTSYGVQTLLTASWTSMGSPIAFAYTYQDMRLDPAVNLLHADERDYLPATGTWIEKDPSGYIQGSDCYQYVASNPTGLTDPVGLVGGHAPGSSPVGSIAQEVDGPVDALSIYLNQRWNQVGGTLSQDLLSVLKGDSAYKAQMQSFIQNTIPSSYPTHPCTKPHPHTPLTGSLVYNSDSYRLMDSIGTVRLTWVLTFTTYSGCVMNHQYTAYATDINVHWVLDKLYSFQGKPAARQWLNDIPYYSFWVGKSYRIHTEWDDPIQNVSEVISTRGQS